jgi:hypothetical protein
VISHSETFFGDVADFVEDFVDLAGALDPEASDFFWPDLFGNEVRLARSDALAPCPLGQLAMVSLM